MSVQSSRNVSTREQARLLLFTILLTSISGLTLGHYVKTRCSGQTWACFKPSAHFVPPAEVAARSGIKPTMTDGWDGQFYLYQSYDPFILDRQAVIASFDAPAYRYQRNFLPAVVHILSKLPLPVENATLFMLLQLVIIAYGTYVTAAFLQEHGWTLLWLIPMHINTGVFETLRHGLPDASADFLLYAVIVFLMQNRVIAAGMTLIPLCLTREPYTLLAACLAGISFLTAARSKLVRQSSHFPDPFFKHRFGSFPSKYWKQVGLFALGPALFSSWYIYIQLRLTGSPTAQGQFMLTWPMKGLWDLLRDPQFYATSPIHRITTAYYASLLMMLLATALRFIRTHAAYPSILLLSSLNSCISWLGWFSLAHSGKNFSHATGLLPLMLVLPLQKRNTCALQVCLAILLTPAVALAIWSARIEHQANDGPIPIHGFYQVDAQAGLFKSRPERRSALYASAGCRSEQECENPSSLSNAKANVTVQICKTRMYGAEHVGHITLNAYNAGTETWLPFRSDSIDAVHYELTLYDDTGRCTGFHRHSLNMVVRPRMAVSADLTYRIPHRKGTYQICGIVVQGTHVFNQDDTVFSCATVVVE